MAYGRDDAFWRAGWGGDCATDARVGGVLVVLECIANRGAGLLSRGASDSCEDRRGAHHRRPWVMAWRAGRE
eukprot:5436252-Prymnesium_polylepis.1